MRGVCRNIYFLSRSVRVLPSQYVKTLSTFRNSSFERHQNYVITGRGLHLSRILFSNYPKHKILKLPSLSPTMERGNIASWDINVGDRVEEGDIMAQIETDKAVMPLESGHTGFLARILIPAGTKDILINKPIAIIVNKKEDIDKFADYSESTDETTAQVKHPVVESAKNESKALSYPPHKIIKLPSLSPTMERGNIASWDIKVGDKFSEGDTLAQVETDKAVMPMESSFDGYLAKIFHEAGSKDIVIGEPIGLFVKSADLVSAFENFSLENTESTRATSRIEQPVDQQTMSKTELIKNTDDRIKASPFAKKIAKESSVNLSQLVGTGPGGRIIASDVTTFLNSGMLVKKSSDKKSVTFSPHPTSSMQTSSSLNYVDIELTNMRRVIADRLLHSKNTIPHYYLTSNICMDNVAEVRFSLNEKLKNQGVKLSFNDFVVKASAIALMAVPECNSHWMGNYIRKYDNADINVAVSTDGGLITPFIKEANNKGLVEISNTIKELAKKARENKLSPAEFQGGTFTISNLGMYGVDSFSAIINPPQSCILAVGAITNRIVPNEDNEPVVKSLMSVTLCADHRVADGAVGALWLKKFKDLLENPIEMLL